MRRVWVLTDRDEGVMGVFRHRTTAIRHLENVDPSATLDYVRCDGSLNDWTLRYRLEAVKVQ